MLNSAICLLDKAVIKFSNNIAISDDKQTFTYTEYQNLSMSIGTYILNHMPNIFEKSYVGIYLNKSCRNLISFMGTLYSGNTYVPFDMNMPKPRIGKIINNLEPLFIITDEKGAIDLKTELNFDESKILIFDEIIKTKPDRDLIDRKLNTIINTDPIYIMYTSGSTGDPKGVVIPHSGVIDYANWVVKTFKLNEETHFGNQAPFHFDNSILDIYGGMLCGGEVYIIPEVFFNFPIKLPELINSKNINLIFWVPTVMINVANSEILETVKMNNLTKILFCGEVMPNKQLNVWRKNNPNALFANLYGPTEITDVCTYLIVEDEYEDNEPLPIGNPCKNTACLILTKENKKAHVNEIGELCILGTGLALGYFKDKDKTDKAFMQNPLNTKYRELIYRTGDLVLKNEKGLLMYVGRMDTQIQHKGNRIELGEIETVAKSLEEFENACILYDDLKQEIVLIGQTSEDFKDRIIINKLRKNLPSYMLPNKIIKVSEIPLNRNGKLDRVYLKKTYLESE